MSTSSEELILIRERIPYTGKGVDALLSMLRKVLTENPYTQEFVCRIGQPIEIAKLVTSEEAPAKMNLHDAIRSHRMEEFTIEKDKLPFQVLWDMFAVVQAEGLKVSHIAVGDKFQFQSWLGVRIAQNRMDFYGTPVVLLSELPADAFLVVGADQKTSEAEDVKFSVKGVIA
jgi:hypothetical protein